MSQPVFIKVQKLHTSLSRPLINGTYFMFARALNTAIFSSLNKPVRIMESKMNSELVRITDYKDRYKS